MHTSHLLRSLLLLALPLACSTPASEAAPTHDEEPRSRPGYVIDSIHPMDELLRRFRAGLAEPKSLAGGAGRREALVRRFVDALAAQDSAALSAMHIDRAEFAWLYFPTSPFASVPYELPPEYHWYQLTAGSNKGIGRALRLFSSAGSARYESHQCDESPVAEEGSRLWSGCEVVWRTREGVVQRYRLFGSILEREGRFKFVSFANRL